MNKKWKNLKELLMDFTEPRTATGKQNFVITRTETD